MGREDLEDRVRDICLELPGTTERPSHGAPAFFVGRQFVMLWPDGHHDHHFPHLWCAAPAGTQGEMIATEPDRFFRPPYVGSKGWLGVRLDSAVDWEEIAAICEDAFRAVAGKRLIAKLDEMRSEVPNPRCPVSLHSMKTDPTASS